MRNLRLCGLPIDSENIAMDGRIASTITSDDYSPR